MGTYGGEKARGRWSWARRSKRGSEKEYSPVVQHLHPQNGGQKSIPTPVSAKGERHRSWLGRSVGRDGMSEGARMKHDERETERQAFAARDQAMDG